FRGFPLRTAEDFDAFVTAFGCSNFPYEESLSNAVRINRTPRVFTANEAPSEVSILLHHEMAQTPRFPGRLFFFCEQPADTGGATPVCRSDQLLYQLKQECPDFVSDCESKGLLYSNVMPAQNDPDSGMGRSWRSTFRAETRVDAEAGMRALGYTWEWMSDDSLRATTPVLSAVRELATGRQSFFNQLIAASQGWRDDRKDPSESITFGDGTPLDIDAVQTASDLADSITFDIPWQRGDVALIDNFAVMHGRRTFTGTRKILVSLVDATKI
ncbi:MAG: TauD/TfdA family dioxygenase, partial [Planctomycetaceae bacterium]